MNKVGLPLDKHRKFQNNAITFFNSPKISFKTITEENNIHPFQEKEQTIENKWKIWNDEIIPDILHIQPPIFHDERGYLMETFDKNIFKKHNIPTKFLLDIESNSRQGSLRGLHYQLRHPQGKLVRAPKGSIYSVFVDLRCNSLTFGQWSHAEISSKSKSIVWVPPGFAHGFYVLSKYAKVVYKLTEIYAPEWERILAWNDPTLKIEWPLFNGKQPILSKKDTYGRLFQELECFESPE